ncbi:hypothetical protein IW261DRAFT_727714 [Armillaria novae-zelandiae]|uniref:Secreted protein n=1 Tax=Armillaria novae-zelandiae TaxID=153914 RepID=A0AA39NWV7_9AGAR|nr:hypothetical protein IW261DRAFT_727714 [Armillaria novae-zelandiae]
MNDFLWSMALTLTTLAHFKLGRLTGGSPICSGDTTCDAGTWYMRANTRLDSSFTTTTISEHVVMFTSPSFHARIIQGLTILCPDGRPSVHYRQAPLIQSIRAGPERPHATLTATITTTPERFSI